MGSVSSFDWICCCTCSVESVCCAGACVSGGMGLGGWGWSCGKVGGVPPGGDCACGRDQARPGSKNNNDAEKWASFFMEVASLPFANLDARSEAGGFWQAML